MQNKILRIITFSDRKTNMNHLYSMYGILHVYSLYQLELAKFVFTFKNQQLPCNFSNYFIESADVRSHSTPSTQTGNFFIRRIKTEKAKSGIKYNGAKLWNDLPTNITDSISVKTFAKKFSSFITNQ